VCDGSAALADPAGPRPAPAAAGGAFGYRRDRFFAPSIGAADWQRVQCHVMRLRGGGDPVVAAGHLVLDQRPDEEVAPHLRTVHTVVHVEP